MLFLYQEEVWRMFVMVILEASYIYPTRGDSVMQLALNILEKKLISVTTI